MTTEYRNERGTIANSRYTVTINIITNFCWIKITGYVFLRIVCGLVHLYQMNNPTSLTTPVLP